ncbi:MAG: rod shape-determining protein [Clostridia bacterium]|nr:rod shape-determining protein [Clostridia bacterium]
MSNNTIALDMGSSFTSIYQVGQHVVLFEPSLIAFQSDDLSKVKAVGLEAKKLLGRTTDSTELVAPVFDSNITDERSASKMLESFLNKITVRKFSARPSVVMSVPCGVTEKGLRAYERVLKDAGVSDYAFIESPVLTAIGLNVSMTNASPAFIVDIGGGTTEIAAVSLDGIICGVTVNIGGLTLDSMLMTHLKEKFQLKIGSLTAENIMHGVCSLIEGDTTSMVVYGQSMATGRPDSILLSARDVLEPLKIFFDKIFQVTSMVLAKLPAEVSADIRRNGVYFSGGLSKIEGLEEYFRQTMGMRANIFADAQVATVLGGGVVAENKQLLKKLRINKV